MRQLTTCEQLIKCKNIYIKCNTRVTYVKFTCEVSVAVMKSYNKQILIIRGNFFISIDIKPKRVPSEVDMTT